MKKEFKIINSKGEEIVISGIKLLRVMHDSVKQVLEYRDGKAEKKEPFLAENPKFWLDATGHLFEYITSCDIKAECWLPCKIKITSDSTEITINKKSIVSFPNAKDSYMDITKEILTILSATKLSHNELANILLCRISGNQYPDSIKAEEKYVKFLDALLVLMFGVEVSRNNDTLLTSLLLLDLIKYQQVYGSRNLVFDWHSAFVSRYGYRWDDWENEDYGGKYPMSQKSTGTGNLGKGKTSEGVLRYGRACFFDNSQESGFTFSDIDIDDIEPEEFSSSESKEESSAEDKSKDEFWMDLLDKYPQRHAVPRREMSLIIHWLDSLADTHKVKLQQADNEKELEIKLKELFTNRLLIAFSLSKDLKEEIKLAEATNKPVVDYIVHNPKNLDSNPFGLKHYVEDNPSNIRVFYSHRIDISCKLIPGWMAAGEKKELHTKKIIKGEIAGFMDKNKESKLFCNYCYSRPLQPMHVSPNQNTKIVITINQKEFHKNKREKTACEITKNKKLVCNPDKIDKTAALMLFFSQAKKQGMNECKQCYSNPASTAEEIITDKMSKLGVNNNNQ